MPNSDPRIPIPQDNVFWMVKQELDALHAEIKRLRTGLTEITELKLEGDASLADALRIADETLNP